MFFGCAVDMLVLCDSAANNCAAISEFCVMQTLPGAFGSRAASECKADANPCHEEYGKLHGTPIGMTAVSLA